MSYFLPPKRYITWPYIAQVLKGEKLLIKQNQVKINIIPPKIKDLTVKNIWNMLREDLDLLRYFPDSCIEDEPPRAYFFSVVSAIRPQVMAEMIANAEETFWRKERERNQVFLINQNIMDELNSLQTKQSLLRGKCDKKISLSKRVYQDDDR